MQHYQTLHLRNLFPRRHRGRNLTDLEVMERRKQLDLYLKVRYWVPYDR